MSRIMRLSEELVHELGHRLTVSERLKGTVSQRVTIAINRLAYECPTCDKLIECQDNQHESCTKE